MGKTGSLLYLTERETPLTMLARSCSSGVISAGFIVPHPYPWLPSVLLQLSLVSALSTSLLPEKWCKSTLRQGTSCLQAGDTVCCAGPLHAHWCLWALSADVRQGTILTSAGYLVSRASGSHITAGASYC